MAVRDVDWLQVLADLVAGDGVAFAKINRLVTGFLSQLRAYDFRDEWDDLCQEVMLSIVTNARAGRLRNPQGFLGYVRSITRNKFFDRLKSRLRVSAREVLPWENEMPDTGTDPSELDRAERAAEIWDAVSDLPDEQRRVLDGVYRQGKTYEMVSADTGLPLGTMKRRLREGLTALKHRFGSALPAPDPIRRPEQTMTIGLPRKPRLPR